MMFIPQHPSPPKHNIHSGCHSVQLAHVTHVQQSLYRLLMLWFANLCHELVHYILRFKVWDVQPGKRHQTYGLYAQEVQLKCRHQPCAFTNCYSVLCCASQIGQIFSCAANNRGHARYAWNQLLKECEDEEEREERQAVLEASQKALHYQTGVEVTRSYSALRRTYDVKRIGTDMPFDEYGMRWQPRARAHDCMKRLENHTLFDCSHLMSLTLTMLLCDLSRAKSDTLASCGAVASQNRAAHAEDRLQRILRLPGFAECR